MIKSRRDPGGRAGTTRLANDPCDLTRQAAPVLELLLLGLLLSLIPLRAVLQENQSLELPEWTRRLDAPIGPLPATTLTIDGLIFGSGLLLGWSRLRRGGPRFIPTGAELGAVLVLAAGIISTLHASQKRWAITGTIDFAALVAYGVTLRQLLTRPWRIRLALCVVLATGTLVVAKCLYQVGVEYPDTIEHFEKNFAATLQAGASPADPGQFYDLRQRLMSQAATGFFTHANVAATYLATMVVAALAVVAARARGARLGWGACVAPGLLAIGALVALKLAQSKGAVVALAAGLTLWAAWLPARSWLRANSRRGVAVFWGLVLAAAVGVVAYGTATGGLPSRSMLFRWLYWRGAAAMVRDQRPWGVGAGNFGRHFMQYKPVECPEDVQDPHSWIVRAAAEWGIVGLAGMLILWIGISVRMARVAGAPSRGGTGSPSPALRRETSAPPYDRDLVYRRGPVRDLSADQPAERLMPLWLGGVTLLVCAGCAAVYAGPLGWSRHAAFIAMTIFEIAVVWGIGFALMFIESREVTHFTDDSLPSARPGPARDSQVGPAPVARVGSAVDVQVGLIVAAIVFLLHAVVDLALFWSGAATLLFAILAIALAAGSDEVASPAQPPPRTPPPRLAAGLIVCSVAALAVYGWFCVLPPLLAGRWLLTARTIDAGATWEEFCQSGALRAYENAITADPLDATAASEMLDELLSDRSHAPRVRTTAQAGAALAWVDLIRRRDPAAAAADGFAARILTIRYASSQDPADLRQAADALERNVQRYPTSPHRHLAYGQILVRLAEAEPSAECRRRAAEELRLALRLDGLRIYISQPNHFAEPQCRQIEADAERLSSGL